MRFPAKARPGHDPGWRPVRVKKTRQIRNLEPRSDSIGTERALACGSRRGITPCDEFRHDKAVTSLAELQVRPLRIRDLAARRGYEGMAGRHIPFRGWGEAGINVGSALRHPAEFDRRA